MNDPFSEPADTREEILGAAYHALCEHGYSDLTIQRIGDEFEKSPSLVYHHYDGKDELLVDLLGFLLTGFEETLSAETCETPPRERIDGYVRAMTDPDSIDEHGPNSRFFRALVELRAQAAHNDAYRGHFDRSDRVFRSFLERAVRDAAGDAERRTPVDDTREADTRGTDVRTEDTRGDEVRAVPPREVASTVQTLATGGMLRWATTSDREWVEDARNGIHRYLDATLPHVTTEE
ncbi:TetR/AcrR family transcriptional regulator [Halorubrum sp. DTA98]|uniref:TetR/AcrR family transcriptional regulator n=1 Tax=Halorubrum sp. DTA98 TaxID=3402163 RepID=UPI003AAF016A